KRYCILAIPLLAELDLHLHTAWIHHVLVVDCPEQLQVERLHKYKYLNDGLIKKILQTQKTREQRLQIANEVIKNDGDLQHLKKQVDALHQKYLKLSNSRQ